MLTPWERYEERITSTVDTCFDSERLELVAGFIVLISTVVTFLVQMSKNADHQIIVQLVISAFITGIVLVLLWVPAYITSYIFSILLVASVVIFGFLLFVWESIDEFFSSSQTSPQPSPTKPAPLPRANTNPSQRTVPKTTRTQRPQATPPFQTNSAPKPKKIATTRKTHSDMQAIDKVAYIETLKAKGPLGCFLDTALKQGRFDEQTGMMFAGAPKVWQGGNAVVFRIINGQAEWAVKCLTDINKDRVHRIQVISDFLEQKSLPFVVLPKFVKAGFSLSSGSVPIIQMEWVSGSTLADFVRYNATDTESIRKIQRHLMHITETFHSMGVAHGDLQAENIMIDTTGHIKLVDFDGMYLPALANFPSQEQGQPNFVHPHRLQNPIYNGNIDNFPAWVIFLSLEIISHDPGLLNECGDEGLLFMMKDFADPGSSMMFNRLEAHTEAHDLAKLAALKLRFWARGNFDDVPPLTSENAAAFTKTEVFSAKGFFIDSKKKTQTSNPTVFADGKTIQIKLADWVTNSVNEELKKKQH